MLSIYLFLYGCDKINNSIGITHSVDVFELFFGRLLLSVDSNISMGIEEIECYCIVTNYRHATGYLINLLLFITYE